jgi:NAD(P)H dehydrogenase (quinone)
MIVVSGASGHLGPLVIKGLLERVPASEIVAVTRTPDAAQDLGVQVRHADFDEPGTLPAAFDGADTLLLISSNAVGIRAAQHKAAIEGAVSAGIGSIVYTSVLRASSSPLLVAPDHRETEAAIVGSGLTYTFLRNGWYTENYAEPLRAARESGVIIGSAGEGRVSSATREDYAAAAVAVLTSGGHDNAIYELGGDQAWSYAELAAEASAAFGRPVSYTDLTADDHAAALRAAGVPEVYVSFDQDISRGALEERSGQLRALIGRPTTTLSEYISAIR